MKIEEHAVKKVKGSMGSVASDLERQFGMRFFDDKMPNSLLLAAVGGGCDRRHRLGKDRRTAEKYELAGWGEVLGSWLVRWVMVPVTVPTSARCVGAEDDGGRFLGHHGRTGALLVMTLEGILRGAGVRRFPEESRSLPTAAEQDIVRGVKQNRCFNSVS